MGRTESPHLRKHRVAALFAWRRLARRLCILSMLPLAPALAQSVVLTGPAETVLNTVTPALTVRASGFPLARPFRISIQAAATPDFASSIVLDSAFTSNDSITTVQITRPLPSDGTVYLRAIVEPPTGFAVTSATYGPKRVPPWLTLITPNSPNGDIFDIRQPLFVWRSAAVHPSTGGWTYELEISTKLGTEVAASGLRDTTFRPNTNLQANTPYLWSLRATLGTGATIRLSSAGSFQIIDPLLPTTTIFYQNFPNPFPSASSFSTCFWFDLGEPGGRVSIDVLDARGNFVKSVVSPSDASVSFTPGRYGRGSPGSGSSCDNRFVWDGTGADGRVVAPGVYLVRFRAGNQPPIFRKALFRPR